MTQKRDKNYNNFAGIKQSNGEKWGDLTCKHVRDLSILNVQIKL